MTRRNATYQILILIAVFIFDLSISAFFLVQIASRMYTINSYKDGLSWTAFEHSLFLVFMAAVCYFIISVSVKFVKLNASQLLSKLDVFNLYQDDSSTHQNDQV